jgi:hypothetical protein
MPPRTDDLRISQAAKRLTTRQVLDLVDAGRIPARHGPRGGILIRADDVDQLVGPDGELDLAALLRGKQTGEEPVAGVRDASHRILEWTAIRDQLIRRARAAGVSLRRLADATGLSHQTIALIEKRSGRLHPG